MRTQAKAMSPSQVLVNPDKTKSLKIPIILAALHARPAPERSAVQRHRKSIQ